MDRERPQRSSPVSGGLVRGYCGRGVSEGGLDGRMDGWGKR